MPTRSTRPRRTADVCLAFLVASCLACSSSSSSRGEDADGEVGDAGGDGGDAEDLGAGDGQPDGDPIAAPEAFTCRDDVSSAANVVLSGAIDCDGCEAGTTLWLYDNELVEGEPLCVATLPTAGDFELEVPAELGATWLYGFGEAGNLGEPDPGEPFGRASPSPLSIESADVAGIGLVLAAPLPATDEMGGAIDEFGDAVTPDRLLARFSPGTEEAAARGVVEAAGAELSVWLDAIDTAIVALEVPAEIADDNLLDPLRAMEAALAEGAGVEAVFRDYRYAAAEERAQDEDYLSLTAVERWAYDYIDQDAAKRVFDQCSYHLGASERAPAVVVGVIDNDLLGAQSATELAGVTITLADHHQHIDREFCGRTPNGFQRLCEPITNLGHGAAVASAIGAINNDSGMNGVLSGFAGTTPGGEAYALTYTLRLFNVGHGASMATADLLNGIQAAGNSDASVINMSLGVEAPASHNFRGYFNTYRSFADLIRAFPNKIWVMAAGNAGHTLPDTPTWSGLNEPQLVTVGATDEVDARSVWSTSTSSNHGSTVVDIAAPGTAVYVADVAVRHTGTTLHPDVMTTVASTQGYFQVNGTSLAAPLVTGALAYLRALDGTIAPAEALRRLRLASDPGPSELGGRRMNFGRLVAADRVGAISTPATYLLSFIGVIEDSSGGCGLTPMVGMECMPIIREGMTLSAPAGIVDDAGNSYTLTGTIDGANAVSLTITGLGVTAGVGPASGTYTGTASVDPVNAANLVITGGSFTGRTRTADGAPADCDYSGTFDATFRGARLP